MTDTLKTATVVSPGLFKLFDLAAQGPSGTYSCVVCVGKKQKAVLWQRISAKSAGTPISTIQVNDIVPGYDSSTTPASADRVAHGSAHALTDVGVLRTELGTTEGEVLSNNLEFLLTPSGGGSSARYEAWLEIFE